MFLELHYFTGVKKWEVHFQECSVTRSKSTSEAKKSWFVHPFIHSVIFFCHAADQPAEGSVRMLTGRSVPLKTQPCHCHWGIYVPEPGTGYFFSCSPKCPSLPNTLRFLFLSLGCGKYLGCLRNHWNCISILDSVVPKEFPSQWDLLREFIADFIKSHTYLLSLIRK